MRKNKLLLLLALLMTAATGAWAQTETLLTTITPTGDASYSETTTGVVTVSLSNVGFFSEDYGWCWYEPGSVTVEAKEGYTITRCVFKQEDNTPVTITTSPFAITFGEDGYYEYLNGATSIEVYGYGGPAAAGYTVSLKDGVKDADKWTVKVGEGQAQALPIGGLKGDGSETVTLQYNGRLKVKGVKAEKKAAAAAAEGHALSASAVGEIVGSDGKAYAVADKDNLPQGVTAVAMIAYVGSDTYDATFKNGLAIALADEKGDMIWSTAKSTCEGKTAITGAKWCLPSQDQWKQMFKANGGDEDSYTGLITTITTAGGATLLEDEVAYWSSSECTPNVSAYFVFLTEGNAQWIEGNEAPDGCLVRACLAF